jgi:hypothetical protein
VVVGEELQAEAKANNATATAPEPSLKQQHEEAEAESDPMEVVCDVQWPGHSPVLQQTTPQEEDYIQSHLLHPLLCRRCNKRNQQQQQQSNGR